MTPPDKKKPEVKPADEPKKPDATKTPEDAAKEAEAVKGDASADRKGASATTAEEAAKIGGAPFDSEALDALEAKQAEDDKKADKPAEGKEKPAEGAEDLPDNEWSQAYYNLKEQLKATPAMQGPLSTLALAFLRLAAKYSNYADLMPGSFRTKILESTEYKGKTLNPEQAKKVLDRANKTDGEEAEKNKVAGELKKQEDDLIKDGRRLGRERASTRFVNNTLLGGIEGIDDATSLAASLIHTQRTNSEGNPEYLYYSPEKNLDTLKAGTIAKGTILIFVPDMSTGEKVVAYATGGGDGSSVNFRYYNVGKKVDGKDAEAKDPTGVIDFKLGSPNCPVKQLGLLAVLEPNFERFAAAPETPPEAPADKPATNPDTKPETKEDRILASIEKENAAIKQMIDEYPKNPGEANLKIAKEAANKNFVAAKETYDQLKAQAESEEFNVTKLVAAEKTAEEKSKATGATDADKAAYVNIKNKREQAEKIQGYWTKIKAIYEAAEANKKAADLLK